MNEIRAKKRVKFTNIKMSYQKVQNEPRWLMSHRLGTPAYSAFSLITNSLTQTWVNWLSSPVFTSVYIVTAISEGKYTTSRLGTG